MASFLIRNKGLTNHNGATVTLSNKTGEGIVQLYADDYGNGVVGAFKRKRMRRILEPPKVREYFERSLELDLDEFATLWATNCGLLRHYSAPKIKAKMATDQQTIANRNNAASKRQTKAKGRKASASGNSLKHGLKAPPRHMHPMRNISQFRKMLSKSSFYCSIFL